MPGDPDGRAERASWLHIALTPGIGPVATARLLAALGLPDDILGASHAALSALLGPALATGLLQHDTRRAAAIAASLDWAAQPGCHLLTLIDPAYPGRLLQTADPPPVLWAQGRLELLAGPALAIVGSRSATQGGIATAHSFAQALGGHGITIVSGLAQGIDAAAHRGALATAGATIAVLGTGTDRVYPRQQAALAGAIARDGLLLSELPPDTEPRRGAFPRRNRLIAGLALGVLVVEAAIQSGSLITARLAADLGREVFAMPGSIHSPTAKGCHHLLKQGARLVESVADVLSELGLATPGAHPRKPPSSAGHLPEDPLLAALGWDPVDPETLLQRLQSAVETRQPEPGNGPASRGKNTPEGRCGAQSLPVEAVAVLERLVRLELSGRVERLPDGRFKQLPSERTLP